MEPHSHLLHSQGERVDCHSVLGRTAVWLFTTDEWKPAAGRVSCPAGWSAVCDQHHAGGAGAHVPGVSSGWFMPVCNGHSRQLSYASSVQLSQTRFGKDAGCFPFRPDLIAFISKRQFVTEYVKGQLAPCHGVTGTGRCLLLTVASL